MATISQNERNAICDAWFRSCGENADDVAVLLDCIQLALPGFNWETTMRARAAVWAPYVASGLSITAFCDEVVRVAAVRAYGRT